MIDKKRREEKSNIFAFKTKTLNNVRKRQVIKLPTSHGLNCHGRDSKKLKSGT